MIFCIKDIETEGNHLGSSVCSVYGNTDLYRLFSKYLSIFLCNSPLKPHYSVRLLYITTVGTVILVRLLYLFLSLRRSISQSLDFTLQSFDLYGFIFISFSAFSSTSRGRLALQNDGRRPFR